MSLLLLGSLLYKKCFENFLDLFSTGSTGWGIESASSLGFFRGSLISI